MSAAKGSHMSLTPLVAVGTLVFTFVNFLTYLRSSNWNGAVTQLIAWVAGIAGVIIAAHTQFASQITFGSQKLSSMSWPTQVFLGLIATSLLSTVNEIKKAIDSTDSAKKAPLIPSPTGPARASRGVTMAANQGVVDLVAGAVTVAHQAAQPDSRILLTALGDQQGNLRISDRRAGSFTVSSTNLRDNGPVAYQILGP
jgi:hypothetical protein